MNRGRVGDPEGGYFPNPHLPVKCYGAHPAWNMCFPMQLHATQIKQFYIAIIETSCNLQNTKNLIKTSIVNTYGIYQGPNEQSERGITEN